MQLKDFVNLKLASADKEASAEGVPLTLNDCKKYKKMCDLKVYGNCFQDGTPTPENPIEVQCVGEKSRNLFDPTQCITYSSVMKVSHNSDGSFNLKGTLGSYNYQYSYPIFQEHFFASGTVVAISSTFETTDNRVALGVMFRDADGNGVIQNNGLRNGTKATLTMPKDTYKFDFVWIVSGGVSGEYVEINNIKIQVEIGTTATEFIPYGKYKVPIVQRGKNYFSMKKAKLPQKTINGITFTPLDDERMHVTGKAIDTSIATVYDQYCAERIPIPAGIYICNYERSNWDYMYPTQAQNQTFLANVNKYGSELKEDGYIYRFYLGIPKNTTEELDVIIDLLLRKKEGVSGNVPYEPYVEPITTNIYLDEPLRSTRVYADYIDGKNKKIHRDFHKYYIDGSQTVTSYSDDLCMVHMNVRCKHYDGAYVSNHFKHRVYGNTVPNIAMANAVGNRIQIGGYRDIDGVTDAESLKQWFAKNPTTFIQPLETPIEEPLNIELPKLNAKTTIIEVDTSLAPSNISGKYIIR